MGSRQALLEKMEVRNNYRNIWHTDLMSATGADFPYCCFAAWCGPCASYLLRKRALNNDLSRYTCCAGYLPCSGHCGESNCPEFCLCTEQIACVFGLVAAIVGSEELSEISNIVYCVSDAVYCSVCACMQTQHKVEMDKWAGKFGPVERPLQPPGPQYMSRIDQPVPPSVGYAPAYPPPPVYGQPVYGQPGYGQPYPPPAYPPAPYQLPPGSAGSFPSK